jgi:hypothetical protein
MAVSHVIPEIHKCRNMHFWNYIVYFWNYMVALLGIPIFGSDFWDPHRKLNSNFVFDSEDSGRKIFFEFQCLESQKIGIPIPKFGIPIPHKKTDAYSSVDTKIHGRKPLPYKMAGELFFPPNLHLLTLNRKTNLYLLILNGKRTYIYSHLTENGQKV